MDQGSCLVKIKDRDELNVPAFLPCPQQRGVGKESAAMRIPARWGRVTNRLILLRQRQSP